MSYSVKEIYYTLQGEGFHTGAPAVFVRFTGCNLWSGREEDREKGQGGCALWCDTDFVGTDGHGGGKYEDPKVLADAIEARWRGGPKRKMVVFTGGEPTLQLDALLVIELKMRGFYCALETNGTKKIEVPVDWVTLSPKPGGDLAIAKCNELKLVYPQDEWEPERFVGFPAECRWLQPKDGPDQEANISACIEYINTHAEWRLSLQTHKLVGLP